VDQAVDVALGAWRKLATAQKQKAQDQGLMEKPFT
jgi:hypothetical protein